MVDTAMAESTVNPPHEGQHDPFGTDKLLDRLSGERFQEWYRERQWRKNIENGQPYFNGPGTIPEPERHSLPRSESVNDTLHINS